MFGLFKTKKKRQEDKQKSLEEQLKEFKEQYKEYFNCYAFTGKEIVIYKEPAIINNELKMTLIDADTPKGYVRNSLIWILQYHYGDDFLKQHRINYIRLKDQMERLGLSITKIKEV